MAKKKQAKKSPAKKPAKKSAAKRTVARAGAKSPPKRSSATARSKKAAPSRSKRHTPKAPAAAKAAPKKAAKAAPKKAAPKKAAKAAPKKAAPARAVAKRASGAKNGAPIRRRDRAGHLDPAYAAELRAKSLEGHDASDQDAFIRRNRAADDLAEELGEEAVGSMTSGEDETEQSLNREVAEERGGPFVPSTAGQEFAEGTDASNPPGATREPFPKS